MAEQFREGAVENTPDMNAVGKAESDAHSPDNKSGVPRTGFADSVEIAKRNRTFGDQMLSHLTQPGESLQDQHLFNKAS